MTEPAMLDGYVGLDLHGRPISWDGGRKLTLWKELADGYQVCAQLTMFSPYPTCKEEALDRGLVWADGLVCGVDKE